MLGFIFGSFEDLLRHMQAQRGLILTLQDSLKSYDDCKGRVETFHVFKLGNIVTGVEGGRGYSLPSQKMGGYRLSFVHPYPSPNI